MMIKVAQLRIKRSSFLAQARTFKRFVFLAWKLYFWHLTRVIKPEKHMCEGALVRFETTGRDKDARGPVCVQQESCTIKGKGKYAHSLYASELVPAPSHVAQNEQKNRFC